LAIYQESREKFGWSEDGRSTFLWNTTCLLNYILSNFRYPVYPTYYHFAVDHKNQDSSVCIVNKLQAGWSWVKSWKGQEVF